MQTNKDNVRESLNRALSSLDADDIAQVAYRLKQASTYADKLQEESFKDALRAFVKAGENLSEILEGYDATINNYPPYLPSFDQFVFDLQGMLEKQDEPATTEPTVTDETIIMDKRGEATFDIMLQIEEDRKANIAAAIAKINSAKNHCIEHLEEIGKDDKLPLRKRMATATYFTADTYSVFRHVADISAESTKVGIDMTPPEVTAHIAKSWETICAKLHSIFVK